MKNLYLTLYLIGEDWMFEGPFSTYLFNTVLEVLPSRIRQEKIKVSRWERKKVKHTLLVKNITIFRKSNSIYKTSTRTNKWIYHCRIWSGSGGVVTKSYLTLAASWTGAFQAPLSMEIL